MKGEVCTRFWWGNLRERNQWGDQDVDGRIILLGVCSTSVTGWAGNAVPPGSAHLIYPHVVIKQKW